MGFELDERYGWPWHQWHEQSRVPCRNGGEGWFHKIGAKFGSWFERKINPWTRVKDAYDTYNDFTNRADRYNNAIKILKQAQQDRLLITNQLDTDRAACVVLYRNDSVGRKSCIDWAFDAWYRDMTRYVWNHEDAIRHEFPNLQTIIE